MSTPVLPNPHDEPVLTAERAGAIVGLGRSAAYDAIRRGDLPSLRIGRRIVVPTARLAEMLGLNDAPRALVGVDEGRAS